MNHDRIAAVGQKMFFFYRYDNVVSKSWPHQDDQKLEEFLFSLPTLFCISSDTVNYWLFFFLVSFQKKWFSIFISFFVGGRFRFVHFRQRWLRGVCVCVCFLRFFCMLAHFRSRLSFLCCVCWVIYNFFLYLVFFYTRLILQNNLYTKHSKVRYFMWLCLCIGDRLHLSLSLSLSLSPVRSLSIVLCWTQPNRALVWISICQTNNNNNNNRLWILVITTVTSSSSPSFWKCRRCYYFSCCDGVLTSSAQLSCYWASSTVIYGDVYTRNRMGFPIVSRSIDASSHFESNHHWFRYSPKKSPTYFYTMNMWHFLCNVLPNAYLSLHYTCRSICWFQSIHLHMHIKQSSDWRSSSHSSSMYPLYSPSERYIFLIRSRMNQNDWKLNPNRDFQVIDNSTKSHNSYVRTMCSTMEPSAREKKGDYQNSKLILA